MTPDPESRRTPLHAEHLALGAAMTDFGGWSMPLRYDSDLAEHRAVRESAGLFDLSHMGEIRVVGPDAGAALDLALVGRPSSIVPGRARYSMICAEDGGVLDDLVVYRLAPSEYLVVANAGNAPLVVEELARRVEGLDVEVVDESAATALVAVQGPSAEDVLLALLGAVDARVPDGAGAGAGEVASALRYYAVGAFVVTLDGVDVEMLLARTGYTGEDGFELYVPAGSAAALWRTLRGVGERFGLIPCGLSARDSLRLEAGMPLYGHELDRATTPYDAGLGRIVVLDKTTATGDPVAFVGREALAARAEAIASRVLVGLRGEGRRAARAGYAVATPDGDRVGVVTSGLPSPTLGHPIAMAYVDPAHAQEGTALVVDVRGRGEPFVVVPLPFYRRNP